MSKVKKIFKNIRVLIFLFFLLISFLVIGHSRGEGIVIKGVEEGSDSFNAGISSPSSEVQATQLERILRINSVDVKNVNDFYGVLDNIKLNESIKIETNKGEYAFLKTSDELGLTLGKKASNNIRKGLELQGGTRILLKPEKQVSDQDIKDIIDVMHKRLNVYGLSDLSIKPASDLLGNKYVVIEIAGVSKEEIREFIAKQGVFEAKIGDEVVFEGGERDVTFVCRNDGTCSGIRDCGKVSDGYFCKFEFAITISPEAAQRQADATKELEVVVGEGGSKYLSKQIDFYLDGKKVDSLNIDVDLKGQAVTNIAITGPGSGKTQEEAITDANENMKKLQTILITGSLPTKLEIVKLDSLSPSLGEAFVKNVLLTGLIAILAVIFVIYIRYRKLKIVLPMAAIMLSEIYLILGLLTLIRSNLDLAGIAGILAAVGTGVDDQIVIADEVLNKESTIGFKERIKRAFFIIFAAYAVGIASMLPLLRAGAGLLTGFALVTILGISIGVFITRPAYANIVKILLEE